MKIKELFEVSDEKIREKDEKKIKWLYDRANREVNVHIAKYYWYIIHFQKRYIQIHIYSRCR